MYVSMLTTVSTTPGAQIALMLNHVTYALRRRGGDEHEETDETDEKNKHDQNDENAPTRRL